MTVLMTFNKEQAVQAGASMGISESGAYIGTLEAHSFTKASNAAGIEFTLNSPDGKAQFLSLYHTKKDGTVNPMGANMIQAIMGLMQIKQITGVDTGKKDYSGGTVLTVPEFEGREIGLILQKELTTNIICLVIMGTEQAIGLSLDLANQVFNSLVVGLCEGHCSLFWG